ncbi:hypothetical protein K466DRAFT_186329 [Polyporus arcularius HHB13444]|uniref:Uncharacterized protein n=1 Tax=Polyporus arcularius HHB13444 TaxID=1314778 RepID=A0A5C3P760_9APHY|nr:hypothetical protein K466DRAFT_186329 [Polyporus arcularius HHB13444]
MLRAHGALGFLGSVGGGGWSIRGSPSARYYGFQAQLCAGSTTTAFTSFTSRRTVRTTTAMLPHGPPPPTAGQLLQPPSGARRRVPPITSRTPPLKARLGLAAVRTGSPPPSKARRNPGSMPTLRSFRSRWTSGPGLCSPTLELAKTSWPATRFSTPIRTR